MVHPDLFPGTKPPRKSPRKLGHVIDAGSNCTPEGMIWAQLRCSRGHTFQTIGKHAITELKRGLPCPECAGGSGE